MDLSAVIFVVLAVAWAVYLIPKALKHHDEMASDRLLEGHSDKVRILSRHGKAARTQAAAAAVEVRAEPPVTAASKAPPVPHQTVTRPAGRTAVRRRRRVLLVLLLAVAVVAGLAYFAIVPWWSTAIPDGMVVLFLVVARLSVRKAKARRARVVAQGRQASAAAAEAVGPSVAGPIDATEGVAEQLVDQLTGPDMTGAPRQEIEEILADDGSLWDPLPLTLPTYVNKARARRTVRTIELTGIKSSGHDVADTALARQAKESAQATKDAEAAQRKAAGA